MTFQVQIDTSNDAFWPNPDNEIRRLLKTIDPRRSGGTLVDVNGTKVGTWALDQPKLMIELYPMTGSGTLAQFMDEVEAWDVVVRPDGGDPLEEHEDLSYDFATETVIPDMRKKYPEAEIDTQLEDLLQ